MKLYFFIAVIFPTFFQSLGQNLDSNSPDGLQQAQYLSRTLHSDSISENCGGILSTATGGIIYKVLGPFQQNERCVWVLRGGRANSFYIDVHYKRNHDDTQVSATCLTHRGIITNVIIDSTGLVRSTIACNVVIITFSTGNNVTASATGLVLQYSATQGGSVSTLSRDHIITPNDTPYLRHPYAGSYSNNELSTFTYLPPYQSRTGAPVKEIIVTYIRNALIGSCTDYLNVYYFNATTRIWQTGQRICSTAESVVLTNQDPILITFDSDSSSVSTGFHLTLSATGGSECGV